MRWMRRSTAETPDSCAAQLRHRRWCHAANGALDRWRYPPWIQPLAPRRESTRPWRTSRSADRQLRARRHSRCRVFHRRTPGLAVRTRRELGPDPAAAAGIGLVVAGMVPTNPALGYPPGDPSVVTPSSVVHQVAGLFLFGGLSGAAFVLAPRLRAASRSWAIYARISGMLIIVFAIAAGIAYRLDTQGIWRPAPAGLLEHVSLLAGFGWLIAIGIYLHRNGTVLSRATSTGTQQHGLPEPHGIVMKVCKDGQAWYAYRATPAGHIFRHRSIGEATLSMVLGWIEATIRQPIQEVRLDIFYGTGAAGVAGGSPNIPQLISAVR